MSINIISSIKISDIDMDKCYFNPGCALSIHSPNSELKILKLLNKYFGQVKMHNICCRHNPKLPHGSTIINNCAGCDRRFRSLYEGIQTISLWEVLDSIEDFPLPVYNDLTVSIQDSCPFRCKPQVHAVVWNLLQKMNIKIIESKFNGTKSICCGDTFYSKLSIKEVNKLQKKRAEQMPCQNVVVYCVSCIKSMAIGGKIPHHMIDLILNESTKPKETNLDIYHNALLEYINLH